MVRTMNNKNTKKGGKQNEILKTTVASVTIRNTHICAQVGQFTEHQQKVKGLCVCTYIF